MAKKSRRARRATAGTRAARLTPPVVMALQKKEVNFAQEYAYVVADLKRIAIIAAAMLVILIVLALIVG